MRTVSLLITAARQIARNVANQDGTYSIPDSEIIQYLNDAQDTMQNKLCSAKNIAKIFVTQTIIPLVANQAEYSIPDRVLLNKQIENVEFSSTGQTSDFVRLEKVNFFQRDTYPTTYPSGYYKVGNQISLQPTPSTAVGSIRVMYERAVDDLVAAFDTVSGTPSGSTINVVSSTAYTIGSYISIVNSTTGVVLARNILISNWTTGVITTSAAVSTYLVGTAQLSDLASQTVVLGYFTTCISQLPDACETYLVNSAAADIFGKDSSNDYTRQRNKADEILDEIIAAYKAQTSEVQFTPQLQRYEFW